MTFSPCRRNCGAQNHYFEVFVTENGIPRLLVLRPPPFSLFLKEQVTGHISSVQIISHRHFDFSRKRPILQIDLLQARQTRSKLGKPSLLALLTLG